MSYDPVRAITSPELALLRSDGQATRLRAVIVPQQTVLACQCAATITNNDAVTLVPINNITSGSVTHVRNGMTAYVGSGAGLDDYGMVRVKACSGSSMSIARHSGITWTPSVHITVVDEFGLWAKLPVLDLTAETVSIAMDDNVYYTNQNSVMQPTPVFGCDTAVPLASGSLLYDGTNSYCLDGSTIDTYAWAVYKGGVLSGSMVVAGTGQANFVFPSAGSYTVELTITASNAKATTGRRVCYVYDEGAYKPLDQIQVDSLTGSRDEGGWNCKVTAYASAGSTVRDRAKVIIIADDRYGSSNTSIGQLAGSERVVMVGAIGGESVKYNREFSTVQFTVQGNQYWLKQITGPSTFLESVPGVPAYWTEITDMTIDKVLHHFLYWRSTAIEVMDVYKSGNTRIIGGMSASIGSIWEQIYDTCLTRMMVYIATDRYGRFFAWEDPQILPVASRTSIPVVQTISDDDLTEEVDFQRAIVDSVALLEVAGLAQQAGGSAVEMYMSRAPGSLIYNRFGSNDQNDRLVVSNQTDANMLSGMLLAKKNNVYSSVNFTLGQNNRMIDIAPAQYVQHTTTADQNVRGVSYTDKKFLPLSVNYDVDENGVVEVSLEAEGETSGIPGYTVIMPQEPIANLPEVPAVPDYPIIPPYPWVYPFVPPYIPNLPLVGGACRAGSGLYGQYSVGVAGTVLSTQRYGLTTPVPGWIRGSAGSAVEAGNPTRYTIIGSWQKLEPVLGGTPAAGEYISPDRLVYLDTILDDWYKVEALDAAGNVVGIGIHDTVTNSGVRSGWFYKNGAGGDITHIRIACDPPQIWVNPLMVTQTIAISAGALGGNCHSLYTSILADESNKDKDDTGYHFVGNFALRNTHDDGYYKNLPAWGEILFRVSYAADEPGRPYLWKMSGTFNHTYYSQYEQYCIYSGFQENPTPSASGSRIYGSSSMTIGGVWNETGLDWFGNTKQCQLTHAIMAPTAVRIDCAYDVRMDIVPNHKIVIADLLLDNICAPEATP